MSKIIMANSFLGWTSLLKRDTLGAVENVQDKTGSGNRSVMPCLLAETKANERMEAERKVGRVKAACGMAPSRFAVLLADRASIGREASLALVEKVRGRAVIAHLLEKIGSGCSVVIVLDSDNVRLRQLLDKYAADVQQVFAAPNREDASLLSLHAALSALDERVETGVIFCPHLLCPECDSSQSPMKDALVTCTDPAVQDFPHSYQLGINGGYQVTRIGSGALRAIGRYQFAEVAELRRVVNAAVAAGEKLVESAIAAYARLHSLHCEMVDNVINLASKTGRLVAADYFFNARDFNRIIVDRKAGIISKESTKIQKLEDEYEWYINLPEDLQPLVPQQYSFQRKKTAKKSFATLVMQFCDYPPLSERFISGEVPLDTWKAVIYKLFEIHKKFEHYQGSLKPDDIQMLYLHKTLHRIAELLKSNYYWKRLWSYPEIVLNGVSYKNIRHYESEISSGIDELIQNAPVTIVHGDYCFSNILFDTITFDCKLIDPRGSVREKERTIYGDPRYDIAKLRHSAVGGYDYAVHGLFNLRDNGNVFELADNYPSFQNELTDYFDVVTAEFGFDVRQIRLLEALIFLTIIPLHKDNIERQKLFYLKAVKKINKLFGGY